MLWHQWTGSELVQVLLVGQNSISQGRLCTVTSHGLILARNGHCISTTNPLSSIIRSHRGIKHHFYADDTQLYITLSPSNFSQSMTALTDCLNDIQNFMAANKLKLNPDKTEFILFQNTVANNIPFFPLIL